MHSRNALILFDPTPPILVLYAKTVKKRVIAERLQYQSRMDQFSSILEKCYDNFPELTFKVRRKKAEIQLQTRGAAATESVLDINLKATDHETDVAQRFLVKKAYRVAASMAHPDKGGNKDDFAAVLAAYKAGDLESLNEFVLSKQKGVIDQITHWHFELRKPAIQWQHLTSTPEYKIVQAHLSGRHAVASDLAREVLTQLLFVLDQQLYHVIRRNMNHGNNHQEEAHETRGYEDSQQGNCDNQAWSEDSPSC